MLNRMVGSGSGSQPGSLACRGIAQVFPAVFGGGAKAASRLGLGRSAAGFRAGWGVSTAAAMVRYDGRMSTAVSPDFVMRHVIAALVTNEPGVLAQVAGMFAARGFNIDSLVVGRTENPELSRMTIVVNGDSAVLEQVRKQLQKLVPVVKVVDYQDVAYVERDLCLIQVSTKARGLATNQGTSADHKGASGDHGPFTGDADKREEIITLTNLFRAKIVDVAPDQVMIEIAGSEEKLEAFLQLLEPYGIIELARTGVIAMRRGNASSFRRVAMAKAADGGSGSSIDAADLPPG